MIVQVADHSIGTLKLLDQTHVFILGTASLPPHEGPPDRLKIVILAESDGKLLPSDEVTKQVFALERQRVDRVAHPVQAGLRRSDQVLIRDDLVNQLLL